MHFHIYEETILTYDGRYAVITFAFYVRPDIKEP
jgi:hypothetical protein